jgi:hypothetical protein
MPIHQSFSPSHTRPATHPGNPKGMSVWPVDTHAATRRASSVARRAPNYPSSRSQPSASSGPLVGFSFFLHVGLLFLRCLLRPPCTVNVRECGGPGSRDSPTPRRTRRQEKTKKKRKKITRRTCTASITYRGAIGVCTYVPSVSCHLPDGMS